MQLKLHGNFMDGTRNDDDHSHQLSWIENDRGNPRVNFLYPYPYPPIPLPLHKGRGFEGVGVGVGVLRGMRGRQYPEGFL
jgi:hypothetical protein